MSSAVSEVADLKKPAVRRAIDSYISGYNDLFVPPLFHWSESYHDRLVGRCHVPPGTGTEAKAGIARLKLIEELAQHLPTIDWSDFERLSGRIVETLGARNVEITGRTGDGGIDFRGEYPMEGLLEGEVRRLLGQSKRWSNTVGPEDMSRFVDACQEARQQSPNTVGVFLTTSSLTRGALDYAKQRNITARGGLWIAFQLLQFGIGCSQSEPLVLDAASVTSWLDSGGISARGA